MWVQCCLRSTREAVSVVLHDVSMSTDVSRCSTKLDMIHWLIKTDVNIVSDRLAKHRFDVVVFLYFVVFIFTGSPSPRASKT